MNQLFRGILQKIIFKFVKIQRNKVVFDHFNGLDYGCNPGSIFKYVNNNFPEIDAKWIISPKRLKLKDKDLKNNYIKSNFLSKTIELASAKVVVFNTLNSMSDFPKKKGQIWVQTGHGSFGIKKIGLDVNKKRDGLIRKEAKKTDVFFSNSKFESRVFNSGFLISKKKIFEIGHARNDVIINSREDENLRLQLKNKLKLPDEKIFMIAPTHSAYDVKLINSLKINYILDELQEKFGGDWIIGLRLHPRTKNKVEKNNIKLNIMSNEKVVDLSEYSDMQDLIVCTDAMLTDSSSSIFDFLLTKKPCFFYIHENFYKKQISQFYYSLEDTPIPIAFDSLELAENIKNFNDEKYIIDIDNFMNKMHSSEFGNATEKAAYLIKKMCDGQSVSKMKKEKNVGE